MTVKKLAQTSSVTPQHIYNRIYKNDLPFHRLGTAIRFDVNEILPHTRKGRR